MNFVLAKENKMRNNNKVMCIYVLPYEDYKCIRYEERELKL